MIMHLRWEKELMMGQKRPNGNLSPGENSKEKMVDRVKGGGALFHFAETLNMQVHTEFSHSLHC